MKFIDVLCGVYDQGWSTRTRVQLEYQFWSTRTRTRVPMYSVLAPKIIRVQTSTLQCKFTSWVPDQNKPLTGILSVFQKNNTHGFVLNDAWNSLTFFHVIKKILVLVLYSVLELQVLVLGNVQCSCTRTRSFSTRLQHCLWHYLIIFKEILRNHTCIFSISM